MSDVGVRAFNILWTGRAIVWRRGAGFRPGALWIGCWSRTSVDDEVSLFLRCLVASMGGGGTVMSVWSPCPSFVVFYICLHVVSTWCFCFRSPCASLWCSSLPPSLSLPPFTAHNCLISLTSIQCLVHLSLYLFPSCVSCQIVVCQFANA